MPWSSNKTYQAYLDAVSASSLSEKKTELYQFMKTDDFYIGNANAVNLFPVLLGVNIASGATKQYYESDNVSVALKDSSGVLVVSDYLEDTVNLNKKGLVKFKSGKSGSFVLTFSYTETGHTMSDISYNVNVIDGAYNVTNATELMAMNNMTKADSSLAIDANEIQDWTKAKLGDSVYAVASACDKFVLLNDFTINKENVASAFFWTQDELTALGCSKTTIGNTGYSYAGSLKDNVYIYSHALSADHANYAIYGNFHRVKLGDPGMGDKQFPYITWDRKYVGTTAEGSTKPYDGQPSGTLISAHAGLLGEDPDQAEVFESADPASAEEICQNYHTIIKDLYCTGNVGVSPTFDPDLFGGVTWFKTPYHSAISNCIMNGFTLGIDTSGSSEFSSGTGLYGFRAPTCEISDSRMYDTYSMMIFAYHAGVTNIHNSDIRRAGGPLMMDSAQTPVLHGTAAKGQVEGSVNEHQIVKINVDSDCGLENWVAGTGGWFAENGADLLVSQFKLYNQFFAADTTATTNPGFGMTYLKDDSSSGSSTVGKLNLLALIQPDAGTGEGIAAIPNAGVPLGEINIKTSATVSGVTSDVSNVINAGDGRTTLEAAGSTAEYQNALATTDFGLLYAAQAQAGSWNGLNITAPIYKAVGTDKSVNYISTDTATCAFMANKFVGGTGGWDAASLSSIQSATMLSLYGFGRSNKVNFKDPANYSSYVGMAPYEVIFGGFTAFSK
jgi:hypothetical protein